MAPEWRADQHRRDHLCLKHWLLLAWASWGEISDLENGIHASMEGRRDALEKARLCRRCSSSDDAQVISTGTPPAWATFGVPPTHTRRESRTSWVIVGVATFAVAVVLMVNTVLHSRSSPAAARPGAGPADHGRGLPTVEGRRLPSPRHPPGDVWMVRVGSCDQLHREEVYAVFNLGPRHFPGQRSVDRRGDAGCRKRFRGYVGVDDGASEMDYFAITPEITDLSLPVVCVVVDVHRDSTTLKEARR